MPKSYSTSELQLDFKKHDEPKITLASISELVCALATAKAAEGLVTASRIKAEEQLAEALGGPERGSKTTKLEDGTKVTVTRGFNYKADTKAMIDGFRVSDASGSAPLKSEIKVKLDEARYEDMRKNDPILFGIASNYVTTTPKKVSVVLKHAAAK